MEDTSDAVFQSRHDDYEIAEKKKYIAYMHWSISRRARYDAAVTKRFHFLVVGFLSYCQTCTFTNYWIFRASWRYKT